MRCIGLLGGMSWESTAVYYRRLNEVVRDRFGGLHSAEILMRSVDFAEIVALQKAGAWDAAGRRLADEARKLEAAGADCVLICTNTMHILAEPVQAAISIPLLHIADTTGEALKAANVTRPLLLATRYTMEQAFYRDRLKERYGIEAVVPGDDDRGTIHDVIFEELCCGVVKDTSRAAYQAIIERAGDEIDAVILGCTEIGLLLDKTCVPLPVFDTTLLHADAAVDFATDGAAVSAKTVMENAA
ncbi:aspartate/glutamate racemase family protein [Acuticoccus sp. M5D2P5]|uniref:aspartate/glutamate racemase family protein n=1 Tax=Acuticoccus kalidii TaxID=2910977 RepID=UPI001F3246C2|nr:aspartate/glutamate racemase family protein [Acuticoccus kalidii]MCF3936702.1 aspartate/glutamate racemase family protein [Acuticoccus kalidii]